MTDRDYADWPPERLRREAAERAGWTEIKERSYIVDLDPFITGHGLSGYPPGWAGPREEVPPYEYNDYVSALPDYIGSVDAALTLPGLAGRPHAILFWPDVDKYQANIRGDDDTLHREWADAPGFAMTACWCKWQDAIAGEGE